MLKVPAFSKVVLDSTKKEVEAKGGFASPRTRFPTGRRMQRHLLPGFLALTLGAFLLPADAPLAANSTCSTSGSTATCTDVPTDGISYTSGISTVNTSDGTVGTTTVNANTIGIRLTQSGANGGSGSSFTFTTISYDHDGDGSDDEGDTPNITVVSSDGANPLLLNGNYIQVNGDGTYTSGGTNYANIDALAAEFPIFSSGGGASGSLTVNNPIPLSGTASSFTTTNADGIFVQSSGGNGGNGGCTTILLATWCDDGDDGGDGGSVAVNSDGTITVNGSTSNQYGIAAISRGGEGGDGGGAFGLFASDAGAGGDGGHGGDVNVVLGANSAITTSNTGGTGVFALSIGGNGGSGGSPSGAVAIGDDGGDGGHGGNVTVTNGGSITTSGNFAHGIYAGSLGAGAGSGSNVGGIVALGGRGGSATNGGTVTVTSSGAITTGGNDAIGIFAQSVGGGGGDGGSGGGLVAIGGGTGSGGDGGTVTVNLTGSGSVDTSGTRSYGILAQSIGGGGGTAGFGGGIVGIGGFGDAAGDGSTVTVNTDSGTSISTSGQAAHGIYAQSIGGGGGTSGTGGGLVGVGAEGGAGGDGGNVTVTSGAAILTTGQDARGIFAQSIGGGGGSANASGGLVSVGGSGSSGGDGGTVTVNNTGNITTTQLGGDAIFAQSIGGGGGSGAASGGAISIGGSGDSGGDGGTVSVTNSGALTTSGAFARGIFAQSVGGGGGSGGDSGGLISIGGSGSDTSPGGSVTVNNSGAISTGGNMSTAVFAQSVGGGGGDGGTSGGVLFTLGGSGGGGGDGGSVTATNSADLTTTGDDSHGIFAQSIGGGGGNGGNSISVSAFVGVAVGGSGGDGGDGSSVTVNLNDLNFVTPTIETSGDRSNGVFAQSVGGGGGNGGFAAQGTIGAFGSVSVAVGGSGGDGGDASTVNVNGDAHILTDGLDSDGLVAQSIGGGGGNGGFAVSLSGAAGPGAFAVSVGVGGSGGDGGVGSTVTVDAGGSIVTKGDLSEGLLAQSVGGGGGNGGFSVSVAAAVGKVSGSVAVGVGGFGGGGGDSGNVSVTYNGNVTTQGAESDAIVSQAIGGGGGNGGFNVSAAISGSATGGGGLAVGVGGFAGDGGDGGTATANVTGDILTLGSGSDGLVVQSVGGGGGNGGFNISGVISISGGGSGALGVGVGGFGGDGGNGTTVNATLTGNATTFGNDATGFLAQSIGGGGGNGGFNVTGSISGSSSGGGAVSVGIGGFGGGGGDAGTVTATSTGNLVTFGNDSDAFVAQSLGGGGGNGGFNVSGAVTVSTSSFAGALSVGIGGFGGDGGDAGTVGATVTGAVTTFGDGSGGVLAQSLGGGGGNGGFNVSGSVGLSSSTALSGALGVGGFGGGGGDAGAVTLTRTGDTVTFGDDADGVVAQSLGGGGGNGGLNVSGNITGSATGTSVGIALGLGGFGGDGGDGGTVDATVAGLVSTGGADSTGVLAQSLGGSGGNGGLNVSGSISLSSQTSISGALGVGGFGGGGGDGDNVTLTRTGDTFTGGMDSDGVVAQSIGGGGGNGGLNVSGSISGSASGSGIGISLGLGGFGGDGGDAGTVAASVTGLVQTTGDDSTGVLAQSLGGSGGNGGLNVSGSIALSSQTAGAATIGIGGFGGGGGTGNDVSLTRVGDTITTGMDSDGVVAQSFGGGGGNGGINVSGSISGSVQSSSFALALGLGGFGGDGGDAGNVTVDVDGNVVARGVVDPLNTEDGNPVRIGGGTGILAQSIGGSGGNGGINVAAGVSVTLSDGVSSGALSLGVGGFGGGGGNAGTVTLTADAQIIAANGDDNIGVAAQSIGGGGGNGAINVAAGIAMDGQITAGVGGFGGDGGTGDNVTATVNSDIIASGDRSIGFLAQSIGGGGGNGGINISGGITAGTQSKTPSLTFGLGGFGGAGNISGDVTATQFGNITVEGADTTGVMVQSIAGGGGNGALNVAANLSLGQSGYTGAIGIGGFGGAGADAGNVSLVSDGNIYVDGRGNLDSDDESDDETGGHGILAQSIGGGGGNGGINVTGVIAPKDNTLAAGVGGFGGGGGNAGTVTVTRGLNSPAVLTTLGDDMNGITAQSIGGGGGNAGMNFVTGGVNVGDNGYAVQLTLGGDGGAAGNGNDVSVTHVGIIQTSGDRSDGLVAQSIGGGGGNAAFNLAASFVTGTNSTAINLAVGGGAGDGGVGANVTVDHTGMITTDGDDASGIFAQSIGGGGGDTSLNTSLSILAANQLTIGIGRVGGSGGEGGDVTVNSDGTIITKGDRSEGILAQSVGNGGGLSGAIQVAGATSSGSGATAEASGFGLSVGLEGGEGGRSGNVTVDATGLIMTEGTDSHGIHAQSVGGGGGIGGAALNTIIRQSAAATIAVGGSGGTGGISGMVDVTSAATILTKGDGAHGIYAQSIGGGGGTGGYAATVGFQIGGAAGNGNNTFSTTVGGVGGDGATGNTVIVDNSGTIVTEGDDAFGINAQSIGGGGGDGGIALNGTLGGAGRTNSLDITIGGSGGDGGAGDDVTVNNSAIVQTSGERSVGIQAQSIGGGGGNGGLVAQINISASSGEASSNRMSINIGGSGGTGGTAGDVTVTNEVGGRIVTEGTDAYGIFAQSVGGGGGNGSSVISANFTGGTHSSFVGLNIGGAGGTGGHGGDVLVDNAGLIDTSGDGAHGIFAQSIGGGGGNGGLALATNGIIASNGGAATPLVTVGGAGGDGEDAGDVTVNNSGQIITRGDNAHGILAQSIGGGGGNAGVGLGLTSGVASTIISNAISAVAGALTGGEGGAGGTVVVNHSGDITVLGNGSEAIKAESINGGGGGLVLDFNGITSLPGGQALPEIPGVGVPGISTDPVLTIIAGSDGSMNSSAGAVTVNTTGTFGAAGNNGSGFAIQAIGGGGGSILLDLDLDDVVSQLAFESSLGGKNGQNNNGGNINSSQSGDLITDGRNTPGLVLQSIGGGGGRANLNIDSDLPLQSIALGLGSTDGSGEEGGDVSHLQTGSIFSLGNQSFGAFAQSVGGGGGLTSFYFGPEEPVQTLALFQALLLPPPPIVVSLTLGSNGGTGLNGGNVNYVQVGDTVTTGDHSIAQFHQSVGGGGGAAVVIGADILNVTLGGSNGAEGDGGDVAVDLTGTVMTSGYRAHGVFLQSVGGGGGAVFHDAGTVNVTLSSDNEGDGGSITFDLDGVVMTAGDEAYGIIAQSIGGGGGWIDGAFAGTAGGDGAADDITLNLDGHVDAGGANSVAVFAQSLGPNGNGDIVITLTADHTINGGTGNGAGVIFDGGDDNVLNNAGTVASRNDQTILGSFGNELIENTGNIIGNVELDGGTNVINNREDAFFLSLDRLWLTSTNAPPPAANLFTNEGTLTVFGVDTVGLTDLRGHFVQTGTGHFPIDVDLNNQITDRLNITGTGDFDGDGELLFLSIDKKFDEYVIAQATGGMTDSGFVPFFQLPTVGFDFMVRVDNGTDLVLFAEKPLFENLLDTASVDMNVVSMAGGLDDIEAVLGIDDPFNRLINLLRFQPDVDALGEAIATMTPSEIPHQFEMEHRRATAYLDFAADCPFSTPVFRFSNGEGCVWIRGGGGQYDRQSANFSPEVTDHFGAASFGVVAPAGENWVVGLGLEKGTAESEFTRNGEYHARMEKDWIFTHAMVGYQSFEGFSVGLTVAGGVGDFESVRRVDVPGFTEVFTTYDGIVDKQPVFTDRSRTFEGIKGLARGDSDMWSISSRLRASYQWGSKYQVRPMLDIDGFYSSMGGYTETGVGLANLTYAENSESLVSFSPAVEFALNAHVNESSKLRAYVRPGALFALGDDWTIGTQFAAAPGGLDPILIKEEIDEPLIRLNTGLQWLSTHGVSFSMEYGGAFGDLTTQHEVSGRLTIRY